MGFSTDYENTNDYGIIAEGEYEVIILEMKEHTTQRGAVGMNMKMIIRNDVEQDSKNRYLFHTLWKRKMPTPADMQVQGYGFNQIMNLAKSVGVPSGKSYETVYALCNDMTNKCIRVTVEHEEYNGELREHIKYMNPTKYAENHHAFKQAKQQTAQPPIANTANIDMTDFEVISDGDIPF